MLGIQEVVEPCHEVRERTEGEVQYPRSAEGKDNSGAGQGVNSTQNEPGYTVSDHETVLVPGIIVPQ